MNEQNEILTRKLNEVARGILHSARELDKWWEEREVSEEAWEDYDPVSGNYWLLHLALDALGVPSDNTLETDACNRANESGEWPADAYCRDCWYDVYDVMILRRNDISGFVRVANGKWPMPENWTNLADLEAKLYGNPGPRM